MKVTLKGVEFDLDGVLPLKVRDWRALEKLGIRLSDGGENVRSIERSATLVQYVLKKARPDLAEDFVDDLTIEELMSIGGEVPRAEVAALDRPT